ncbi:MAG: hypothetical protein GF398_07420 [Chitinivibrionales bacterium]|nr:hypothetical protein [Chitinivibrionales bacterium]
MIPLTGKSAAFCAGLILALTGCTSHDQPKEKHISLAHERIYVAPVANTHLLMLLDEWPEDSSFDATLLKRVDAIRTSLTTALRDRQNRGMYELAADSVSASAVLRISINRARITNDTLDMPVTITLLSRHRKEEYSWSVTTRGTLFGSARSPKALHRLAVLLTDYRRSFPYSTIVSRFLPAVEDH